MIYCPQCGAESPAAARFCDQCGAALIVVPGHATPTPRPAAMPASPRPQPLAPAVPVTPVAMPLSAGPIVCTQCGATALLGEAFCDNCGASLSAPAPVGTPSYTPPPALAAQPVYPAPQPSRAAPAVSTPALTAPVQATLAPARLVFGGASLALPAAAEATVGRSDPVSSYTPEVDLAQHGALDHGVGRRHARLFIQHGQVLIEDLDSTNGSLVNGQRLVPHQPLALRDGDQIQFGKLRMQFLA